MYTLGQGQERPELPLPECDPPTPPSPGPALFPTSPKVHEMNVSHKLSREHEMQ